MILVRLGGRFNELFHLTSWAFDELLYYDQLPFDELTFGELAFDELNFGQMMQHHSNQDRSKSCEQNFVAS